MPLPPRREVTVPGVDHKWVVPEPCAPPPPPPSWSRSSAVPMAVICVRSENVCPPCFPSRVIAGACVGSSVETTPEQCPVVLVIIGEIILHLVLKQEATPSSRGLESLRLHLAIGVELNTALKTMLVATLSALLDHHPPPPRRRNDRRNPHRHSFLIGWKRYKGFLSGLTFPKLTLLCTHVLLSVGEEASEVLLSVGDELEDNGAGSA